MKLKGVAGETIKIITQTIKKEMHLNTPQIQKKHKGMKIGTRIKKGELLISDWNNIYIGLKFLNGEIQKKLTNGLAKKVTNGEELSKIQKIAMQYKSLIEVFMNRIQQGVQIKKELHIDTDSLYDYAKISQAARDGIITKKKERIEVINGEKKKVIYDTTMTPEEVMRNIEKYDYLSNQIYAEQLTDYLGIGLSISGIVGSVLRESKEKIGDKSITISVFGELAVKMINNLVQRKLKLKEKEKEVNELEDEQWGDRDELLGNEQISHDETEMIVEDMKDKARKKLKAEKLLANGNLLMTVISEVSHGLIMGVYMYNSAKVNENGKIDNKSFAMALASMKENDMIISKTSGLFSRLKSHREKYKDFDKLCEQTQSIISQMEEKVYPLQGAEEPFDSFEIRNLDGKFYPKHDYDTGEIKYSTKIKIPEFSIKRGDVVLLSGASGSGKSTFLRMLKRGDINNRDCITLDNGKKVDNLGNEFISFRPSMDLGDESSVLYQITGKRSISDLSKNEKTKLNQILQELSLNFPNPLELMATRKFMEFSTGQQKRLILSKLFYRIGDGASVVIVDEPVGNVEDKLIREQLEMIKRYAMRKNVMLLLTTHRLDLAEDLATK